MRSALPILLIVLAACGSGKQDASDTATTVGTVPAVSETTISVVAVDGCEDVPDAADYVEGEIPQAVRPCETPTALVTHTIRPGMGREAQDGDTVIVDYVGIRAEDGAVFDDSYSRGVPIEFPLGRGGVILGWDDGLVGTQAGSLVKLDIPAILAYGESPPGGDDGVIQPDDALSFVVEVRSVIAPVTADDAPLDLEIEPSIDATEVTVTELQAGDGAVAQEGDTVVAHLLLVRGDNQVVIYNTWELSDPLQIILADDQTLPGIREGLEGAHVGSLLQIAMPPEDAFGAAGEATLGLPAETDLIAIVEIVGLY